MGSYRKIIEKSRRKKFLPTPSFCEETWARRGGRFLRTPRRWFLPSAGGLQPIFVGRPSIPPSFEETHPVLSGEFFPAGIPHPSLSPPGNPSEEKTGGGQGKKFDQECRIWRAAHPAPWPGIRVGPGQLFDFQKDMAKWKVFWGVKSPFLGRKSGL